MGLSWQQGPPGAGLIRAGVTDFAQQSLGDVVDVTLPRPGDTWRGVDIESAKRVSELIAPPSLGPSVPANFADPAHPDGNTW
jgi:glycine cleavage system H protein